MRVIKPGKIAGTAAQERLEKNKRENTLTAKREVWDDFTVAKKKSKRREYEKGSGDRMVPAHEEKRAHEEQSPVVIPETAEERKPRVRTDYEVLEQAFGYKFVDRTLVERALTHRSALGLRERADYERLEFLGDAVLDLSVAHLLSDRHPDAREGELSKMRAALVNTQALADIARVIDIGPFIRLGRGELSSGGHERPSILADVMEAIIGAIYRDSGYTQALQTIEKVFGESLNIVTPYDPKTELQEVLHVAGSEPPSYLLEMVEGPEHAPTFVTVVLVDGDVVGRGRGPTKKASQQEAAAQALERLAPSAPVVLLVPGQEEILADLLLSKSNSEEPVAQAA